MLFVDHGEAQVGEVHALVEQRMRADDDLGGVFFSFFPASARVSRVGFRVSRKRTFHAVFVVLRPNPRIILAGFSYS